MSDVKTVLRDLGRALLILAADTWSRVANGVADRSVGHIEETAPTLTRRYGGSRTIHQTGHIDVEIDMYSRVVSVWFRCHQLPFKQYDADPLRANRMRVAYENPRRSRIVAIEFEDIISREGD